jgi:tetratricopeptide (TPR) repeat protein
VSTRSPRYNGDYQVLRLSVDRDRNDVQKARAKLATTLDQLGEHHVRQKEYDDAMDAFTEALHEKRSVFSHLLPSPPSSPTENGCNSAMNTTPQAFTFFGEDGGDCSTPKNSLAEKHDQTIDEIVQTLRNMGNVHSLRGEQDEAMRYYTEVTNLRAQKSTANAASLELGASGEHRSLLSGLNMDDNSTLMSEINEDVKALDDLFNRISFRGKGAGNNPELTSAGSEKRKSKPLSPSSPQSNNTSNKRRKSDAPEHDTFVENEPFKRSTSSLGGTQSLPTSGSELQEALDLYKTVLESYCGPNLEQHKEYHNSLALRADLLQETQKQSSDGMYDSLLFESKLSSKAADLDLALEIYHQVLVVHEENKKSSQSTSSSSSSLSSSSAVSPSQSRQPQTPSTPLPPAATPAAAATTAVVATAPAFVSSEADRQAASRVASTLICMGSIYYKLGNRVEELRMYREAKAVYRKAFGENHTFVAGTRKNIGMVLAERGEYDLAMAQFDKAMRIYLDANHGSEMNRDVASAISCMGNVKNRVGELDAALSQYMEALRIYKSIHEEGASSTTTTTAIATTPTTAKSTTSTSSVVVSVDVVASSNHSLSSTSAAAAAAAAAAGAAAAATGMTTTSAELADALRDVTSTLKVIGMVHAKKGDLDTAMSFFQEAMTLLRSSGVDSTSAGRETTASVLTRIASMHLKKGDLDQAMAHYREAYDLTVRNRGTTNHQEVAGILHYIGGIYHKRADFEEAMSCYQEAIRIYHSTLGPGNPTVAGTLVMVGSIHYKRRNLDSAMMFYREALRLNRDAYGMHHPDVAPILKSIGTILTKKGDYKEAYDIFRDVLSIKCAVHGTGHPEVASAYKSLGNIHYKLGDLADAERQYRHALSIYRRTKGEDHADTISARTTIEHLRYWMLERDQRKMEERNSRSSRRSGGASGGASGGVGGTSGQRTDFDERSC